MISFRNILPTPLIFLKTLFLVSAQMKDAAMEITLLRMMNKWSFYMKTSQYSMRGLSVLWKEMSLEEKQLVVNALPKWTLIASSLES